MDLLGPADEAHARHAVSPAVECLLGGGDEPRIVREAEVVVGAEVEHLAPTGHFDRGLLGGEDDPLGLVEALGADLVQL